jgi:plastocyanin
MSRIIFASRHVSRTKVIVSAALLGALLVVTYGSSRWFRVSHEQTVVDVSQKGREFRPAKLELQRGDTIEIKNDDGDFTHHTYISSDAFRFDSGDQAPGRSVEVTFSKPGTFEVLCGIHPKMRLSVTVR